MPTVEYELYKGGQRDELCDMTSTKVIAEQIRAASGGATILPLRYCLFILGNYQPTLDRGHENSRIAFR